LIWEVVKNLLELLVTETPFELTFVNNPESGRVEVIMSLYTWIACLIIFISFNQNRAGLARMMGSVTPHGELHNTSFQRVLRIICSFHSGTGGILEKLDNVLLTELRELLVLPSKEAPNHKKLKVIVILRDLPTGT
jgi:hypothetical protein